MARRICSALALGGCSCYRDWHHVPVASERVANIETTPNRRIARLGVPDCFSKELLQLFKILDFELGFNLQSHCSDLVHFDQPWNPSR